MKHIPKKRFGQNFLTDQNVLHEIIRAIAPQADDLMVEIGPGQGAMTRLLLAQLKHLQVVELDRDLVVLLKKQFSADKLQIHSGDALQFDFASIARAAAELRIRRGRWFRTGRSSRSGPGRGYKPKAPTAPRP